MQIEIDVPCKKIGKWEVQEFEITKEGASFHNLRCAVKGDDRPVITGTYKRLINGNGFCSTIMSNTSAEIKDFIHFTNIAHGNILVNGLGLGVVVKALLNKENVRELTVIEIEKDVISLVAPTYSSDKRLTIINVDAFIWKPPEKVMYDFIWHDIWNDICTDNLKEMAKLHRKYGRRTNWQDSWCKKECLNRKREERASYPL